MNDPNTQTTLRAIKLLARVSLGLVWIYEVLVPKILMLHSLPEQTDLVQRSGLYWRSPELTLLLLGAAQVVAGVILVIGWAERAAVLLTTLWMVALIVLVAAGSPAMLTDPFGALAKDVCLLSCAATVWLLAPIVGKAEGR
jgi:uncharacterized membrane protein YphA (DoxX/SURF4 family)